MEFVQLVPDCIVILLLSFRSDLSLMNSRMWSIAICLIIRVLIELYCTRRASCTIRSIPHGQIRAGEKVMKESYAAFSTEAFTAGRTDLDLSVREETR